ncbi:ribonuclease H-like protein [Lentithecium fluviatile CBS 122367]|uniref:Ribonuclease H n=1 Tax=Lentithecium fluviatile CBS 122367 TaxID=1168545 RepID=A0A6G1JEV7_9PLEO|nr:ribonuclease H-like protein [Lentithecium fluviatile CBS 122367]
MKAASTPFAIHRLALRVRDCRLPARFNTPIQRRHLLVPAEAMADARSTSTTSSNSKRKRPPPAFYAVKVGHQPGVYYSWADTKAATSGVKNPVFKKFSSLAEAESFVGTSAAATPKPGKKKFYGVQIGHVPGVYTDYASVLEQVTGFKGGKQKSFMTREEAQNYVDEGRRLATAASTPISLKGHLNSAILSADTSEKSFKKQKKNDGSAAVPETNDSYEPGPLIIYTDGAAKGNGKLGAVAGIGIWFGPDDPRNESNPLPGLRQTNQRAELAAISRALDIAPINRDVIIYSDSHYSIQCVTVWYEKWEENRWKNSAGKDVENKDLIKPIRSRLEERETAGAQTELVWVKGHNKNVGNEGADKPDSE